MLATAVRLAGGDQNQASGFERQVLHVPSTRDQHLPEVGLQLRTAAAVQWVHGAMSLEQACFCSKECFLAPSTFIMDHDSANPGGGKEVGQGTSYPFTPPEAFDKLVADVILM